MQPNAPAPSSIPPHPPEYGFIMNPDKPSRRGLPKLPSDGSPVVKIAIILGGLLVLLILFVIIRGLFTGGGNTEALITVAQNQQEIIHLAESPAQQAEQPAVLSATNQNFAVTATASLASAQTQLLTYLKDNGHKVNPKQLNQKVSATTDEQLKTAASNSTFNNTFQQVMQAKLKDYQTALQQAYKQTSGPKGRQLLDQQYQGSELLLKQLNTPQT